MVSTIEEAAESLLREALYEDWMDEADWQDVKQMLAEEASITVESVVADLQAGLDMGYSLSLQRELSLRALKRLR